MPTQDTNMISFATRADITRTSALQTIVRALEKHGWELVLADMDMHRGHADVRLRRFDGRWLHLRANAQGAVVERWQRGCVFEKRGGLPGSYPSDAFLGRQRCEGARSAFRTLCNYVADNPMPGFPVLDLAGVRRLLGPMLSLPVQ